MPSHFSIATAIDKNKIASSNVYLILLEVDVIDPSNGLINETIYTCSNSEPFVFAGNTYATIPFEIQITEDSSTSPTCTLTVYDLAQVFQAALQAYGYSLSWPARIKVVNTATTSVEPDLQYDFVLLSATAKDSDYSIAFTVGAENPLTLRFPPRQQFRNRCFWPYKGPECGYSGPIGSCDLTFDGTNGCRVHGNTINYGGFFGINVAQNTVIQ